MKHRLTHNDIENRRAVSYHVYNCQCVLWRRAVAPGRRQAEGGGEPKTWRPPKKESKKENKSAGDSKAS